MARNTSDSIEEYIKELLGQSGIAEIQRSNLADTFQVVPSQINYVIKTRFTESRACWKSFLGDLACASGYG